MACLFLHRSFRGLVVVAVKAKALLVWFSCCACGRRCLRLPSMSSIFPRREGVRGFCSLERIFLSEIRGLQSLKLKNDSTVCGLKYWIVTVLQIPVACWLCVYEAIILYTKSKQKRECGNGDDVCGASIQWGILQILFCAFCGILGGMVGGLLGSGGGFILGPLLLELGVIPQVASATATFVMMFSSSLSVMEFYFLHGFPIKYALYLTSVSVLAGFWGQYLVRKLVTFLGKASIIVFILSGVIFASALTMGAIRIETTIHMINEHEYMDFLNLCQES